MEDVDQSKLLELALQALGNRQHETAILILQSAVARTDASAQAHYLLGAEYAQVQLYERAIAELEKALAKEQSLHTARLQLALLYLGASKPSNAISTLAPLLALANENPFRHFGEGLVNFANGNMSIAKEKLATGIPLNSVNPALNTDMQKLIDKLDQDDGASSVSEHFEEYLPTDPSARHIFLSAYASSKNN